MMALLLEPLQFTFESRTADFTGSFHTLCAAASFWS